MNKYNLIIPVTYRDYDFLKVTIRYIQKNLSPKSIYIITDIRFKRFLPKVILENEKCHVIDENSLLENLTFDHIKSILTQINKPHYAPGWYFQQLLKLSFAYTSYCDEDYYLSWDADTVPLQKIPFFSADNHPLFTMKYEHHEPYFATITNLFSFKEFNRQSYIAENMLFSKEIVNEMLTKIESNHNISGKRWFDKIFYAIPKEAKDPYAFSEFETYGNYCYNYHKELYQERQLPTFREGGMIQGRFITDRILDILSFDLATVSFEIGHRPPFPWNKMAYAYARWQRRKELFIRKWLL